MDALDRALKASACNVTVPARTVKTEETEPAPTPEPALGDTIHAAVAFLVLNNTKNLLELLAPAEGPRTHNSAKRPLIHVLFRGLRRLGKQAVQFVAEHFLPPPIAIVTVKSYLTNTKTVLHHEVFTKAQVKQEYQESRDVCR